MDLLADLTPAQREAVTHVDGPLLILAAAGSGKTRVITRRIAYLLDQGIAGRNILAITFTNKAAGEMRQRVQALVPHGGVWVGTFHSLCARLLRTYAPRIGLSQDYTIYDQADRLRAVRRALHDLELSAEHFPPDRVEAAISKAKNDLVDPDAFARRSGDYFGGVVARVYRKYQEDLRASNAADFDDLLLHIATLLKDHPDVRAELDDRFRYILIDEYQDTNLAQYAIVRGLAVDHPNLCVVGDPDQSIYGWRGANIHNILEFETDFPGTRTIRLEQNYRSTKSILRAAGGLIRFNRARKHKEIYTANPDGPPVTLTVYEDEAAEARGVARRIRQWVQGAGRRFRDVAVFCRMNALTRTVELALRQEGVPYTVVSGVGFYERQEVKDLLAYLKLVINPRDAVSFLRVINAPPRGIGKVTLDRLQEFAARRGIPLAAAMRQVDQVPAIKGRQAAALARFADLLDRMGELRHHTAEEAIRQVLRLSGYRESLDEDGVVPAEERQANLDELISAARQYDEGHPDGSLAEFLQEISLVTDADAWDDAGDTVALMTLHAAKGLEFPAVFIIAVEDGILPHQRSAEDPAQVEEERRLLFVGMTRAAGELFLSHTRIREFRGQRRAVIPSSFLAEIPDPALHREDRASSAGPRVGPPPSAWPNFIPSPAAIKPADGFQPGMLVRHPDYGLGRIVALSGLGSNRRATIQFNRGGQQRTFVLEKAPIEAVP